MMACAGSERRGDTDSVTSLDDAVNANASVAERGLLAADLRDSAMKAGVIDDPPDTRKPFVLPFKDGTSGGYIWGPGICVEHRRF